MRLILFVLMILLLWLQFRLWVGDGSLSEISQLKDKIQQQQLENEKLTERNQALEAQVADLKSGLDAIEELARSEMGMIKQDETFYQIIEAPEDKHQPLKGSRNE